MSPTNHTPEEIAKRGEELYREEILAKLAPGHDGDFVVIDIASGAFEVSSDDLTATKRLMARRPNAVIYGLRIGHSAAYRL